MLLLLLRQCEELVDPVSRNGKWNQSEVQGSPRFMAHKMCVCVCVCVCTYTHVYIHTTYMQSPSVSVGFAPESADAETMTQRVDYTTTFYLRDLSIHGSCYLLRFWNQPCEY